MKPLINVIAYITAKPGSEAQVEKALKIAEQEVQSEAGCQSYVLTRDIQQTNRYVMLECWSSLDALEVHKHGSAYVKLGAAIEGLAELEVIITESVA